MAPRLKAVVLAAGRGERLWPLTETTPKPMLPLAGQPIIEQTLRGLVKAGIREIAIVTGHKEERVKEFVGNGSQLGFRASFVHQESPMGTADALRSCKTWLEDESKFILVYGDDYYSTKSITKFVESAGESREVMIGAVESQDPSRFGRLEIEKGRIQGIREKAASETPAQVNAGIYLLNDSILKIVENLEESGRGEFELTDAVNQLIDSGESVLTFKLERDDWQSITYPWELIEATYRKLETISHSVSKGRVEKGARIVPPVQLGKGSIIKAGCRIEGPVIIGEGCVLGPNAYIRPFTSIGRNCKVGASCEVKGSILMDDAKVPHLSYIGDSIIGSGTSLGAGTITANLRFDDSAILSVVRGNRVNSQRRKLGAILGDGVRTGINVSIFPGVKVGSGAWIWPGVRVNRDVLSGERVKHDTE